MKKVTVMIPVYNEQSVLMTLKPRIELLMRRHPQYAWEVLFVDDGSTDDSLSIMKRLREEDSRYSYLTLSRNFGKEKAVLAGLDYASGECVINMDADLQDPPEVVDRMLELWEQGYEDVYGHRRERGRESALRRRLTLFFYKLQRRLAKIDIIPNVGDFRLLDRRCVDSLRQLRETERYNKGLYCWIGYRKAQVDFDRSDRVAGKSSWGFMKLLNLAIEGITSFSTAPLRLASIAGIFTAVVSLALMVYYLVKTLVYGDAVAGFPTLVVLMLFLGSVQLIALGIIGEYLGRVFVETKRRPVYLANEYNGTAVRVDVPPAPGAPTQVETYTL